VPSLSFMVVSSPAPAPTALWSLSLHDALPILGADGAVAQPFLQDGQCIGQRGDACGLVKGGRDRAVNLGEEVGERHVGGFGRLPDRKSTRLNSSHVKISYAVFCLKKKTQHRPL